MHELYIGIGSNLGDRQANILAALQRLRANARDRRRLGVLRIGGRRRRATGRRTSTSRPRCTRSWMPRRFARFARDVERAVGRARGTRRLEARPIDIDLLVYDGNCVHPLDTRPYNAVPLAEIAPHLLACDAERARAAARAQPAFRYRSPSRRARGSARAQSRRRLARAARRAFGDRWTAARLSTASFDGRRSGAPIKSGVHMSRFAEILEEATLDVLAATSGPARIERLVEAIAREIVAASARSAPTCVCAREFGLERWTPVSGKRGEETYTLVGIAHADTARNAARRRRRSRRHDGLSVRARDGPRALHASS